MFRGKKSVLSVLVSLMLFLVTLPLWAADKNDDEETIRNATSVLTAMLASKDVPQSALAKADCVIVMPRVKKFAVGIGGTGGRGPMSCRQGANFSGKWSPPAMYSIGGASAGFQVGGTSTDFVLLVMASSAVQKVLDAKVKVGSDVTAAAGPGATAGGKIGGEDILTYARAKGLFAGVSLDGSSLEPDSKANERLYGKDVSARQIVSGKDVKATPAGTSFVSLLNGKGPKHTE
jgi:lipid-binding SYLF domain-containing protein